MAELHRVEADLRQLATVVTGLASSKASNRAGDTIAGEDLVEGDGPFGDAPLLPEAVEQEEHELPGIPPAVPTAVPTPVSIPTPRTGRLPKAVSRPAPVPGSDAAAKPTTGMARSRMRRQGGSE